MGYGRFTDRWMVYLVMLPFQLGDSTAPMSRKEKVWRLSPNLNCFRGKRHIIISLIFRWLDLITYSHLAAREMGMQLSVCSERRGERDVCECCNTDHKDKGLIVKYMESGHEKFKHFSGICL